MSLHYLKMLFALAFVFSAMNVLAQGANPYGLSISLENAKKVSAAAVAEARKNNWTMAIAIVDPSGTLVYFEKMDNTQLGSVKVAMDKARSAALFKRSTKVFQDRLTSGNAGLPVLSVEGVTPGGRHPAGDRRPHCRCHRRFRRQQRTRRPVRPGRYRFAEGKELRKELNRG